MATLVLPEPRIESNSRLPATAASLRSWLDGDWAILFSHPDDFAGCDLEADRWLTILQRKFADQGVRPLALAKPSRQLDCGWVAQVSGNPGTVLLRDPAEPVDFQARRLHDEISAMQQRFVMIIDATLCWRRTYSYVNPAYVDPSRLPSPLDFVGWVRSLRWTPSAADHDTPDPRAATAARPRGTDYLCRSSTQRISSGVSADSMSRLYTSPVCPLRASTQ